MAILIKRYANRKLYNTESSRYITLKGLGELLDRGEEVRVVDNETGEDITPIALSQILVDHQRAREDPSNTLLSQLLTRGGDAVYSAIRRSVDDASDGLGEFQERFRQLVQRMETGSTFARRGERDPEPSSSEEPHRDERGHAGRVDRSDASPPWPSRGEIERLNRNLERVAAALERLEDTLAKPPIRN